jgi:response regulator RpfG family c-di-GMP phosphodiesterase
MIRQSLSEMENSPLSDQESKMTKVLFVDDEENILKSLQRLLMDEELDMLTSTSGEQGLSVLRENTDIALIVSDQRMPGLTGAEFLQKSREIVPDALRIMLTGYADINATIDAINKGGAYRYIGKPWNDEELIHIIRDAIRQCRLLEENKRLTALVERQNEELKEWNSSLKNRVLEQTAAIRSRNDELSGLNNRLQEEYDNCMKAFFGLVELRDGELGSHSRNVARLSVMIAEGMNLPESEKRMVKVGAILHDIGKIGISDAKLHQDMDGLNGDEQDEYRMHAIRGQAAMDYITDLRPAGVLIRHHHENFDGSGFPDGLAKADIPLGSRIIALADHLDRAFARNSGDNAIERSLESARSVLGRKFDPALFPLLEQTVQGVYGGLLPRSGVKEMELQIKDLREGMVVARDVHSGTGILLLGQGESLDLVKILALRRYYQIDPPKQGVLVQFQDILRSAGAL